MLIASNGFDIGVEKHRTLLITLEYFEFPLSSFDRFFFVQMVLPTPFPLYFYATISVCSTVGFYKFYDLRRIFSFLKIENWINWKLKFVINPRNRICSTSVHLSFMTFERRVRNSTKSWNAEEMWFEGRSFMTLSKPPTSIALWLMGILQWFPWLFQS